MSAKKKSKPASAPGAGAQSIAEHRFLFHKGRDYRAYEFLGAHILGGSGVGLTPEDVNVRGVQTVPGGEQPSPAGTGTSAGTRRDRLSGVVFRVWAPRAAAVALVGEFNNWDPSASPMQRLEEDDSIWEVVQANAGEGDLYKYVITDDHGKQVYKADPYAFSAEAGGPEDGHMRASVIWDPCKPFRWNDLAWRKRRDSCNPYRSPMNIYECHLGSWRRKEDGSFYSYRELAARLIPYVKRMGYTHMELLPIMEYPYEGSWGYQITGYYAVTSRYGTPEDFRYFVNKAHEAGIGVILDWVPAHFPRDEHGLAAFDGYPLYEDSDPLKREHKGWGTLAFDFGRPEVISFLISNAFFYCDVYHIDGLRVDAVAAMLYLDYDRGDGEWRPNRYGGNKNLEAIAFLQNMNRDVLGNYPGVLTIAEESTAWPNVTKPPSVDGLGFNFKWNMGWMNDALQYFQTDPLWRRGSHNKLTFSITYAYSENFILPISHDEVVHGKKSLLDKMPGEYEDKFAQLRVFYTYMFTHPGKKLTFMGAEFGQFIEWNEERELDWLLLDYEKHRKLQSFVRELNHYYTDTDALWETDDTFDGFRWIDADNADDNVFTYMRFSRNQKAVLIALNLSGKDFPEFDIGVPAASAYRRAIDTDMKRSGGTGSRRKTVYHVVDGGCNGYAQHITIPLPKFSAIILEKEG